MCPTTMVREAGDAAGGEVIEDVEVGSIGGERPDRGGVGGGAIETGARDARAGQHVRERIQTIPCRSVSSPRVYWRARIRWSWCASWEHRRSIPETPRSWCCPSMCR